jgi:hypothetical protein
MRVLYPTNREVDLNGLFWGGGGKKSIDNNRNLEIGKFLNLKEAEAEAEAEELIHFVQQFKHKVLGILS